MSSLWKRWRLLPIFLIILTFLFTSVFMVPQREVEAQVTYGVEQWHPYKSTIDGTTLPCSIYKPNPADVTRLGGNPAKIPLWVDLHAFGGHGTIPTPDTTYNNMFVLSPWGRNYKSMYADGKEIDTPEPYLFDDFSSSATGWTPMNGTWAASSGKYQQTDPGTYWKVSDRSGSNGSDYTVTVDLKETQRVAGESAMGILFRKQASADPNVNNDCYWLDLDNNQGLIYLRLFRFHYATLTWTPLSIEPIKNGDVQVTETDPFWTNGVNLKVNVFEDVIEAQANNYLVALDPNLTYHNDNTWGGRINDATFGSGGVALASFGGTHTFDNFRVQNELLFGESDVIDCINQFIEEFSSDTNYRVDPTKIYLSGYSMGGVGTWNVGLHNPDLFCALHPAFGTTDLFEGYNWIKTYYPDTKGVFCCYDFLGARYDFKEEQDAHIGETVDAFLDGTPGSNIKIDSALREYSARWILENSLNMPMRIEHPQYDSLIPNVVLPLNPANNYVCAFWATFYPTWWPPSFWQQYTTLVPQYAHANYVWQKWQSITGLTKCSQETSGWTADGIPPSNPSNPIYSRDPNDIWDNFNYSISVPSGAHGLFSNQGTWGIAGRRSEYVDFQNQVRIWSFWNRATSSYYSRHMNPPEVALKTYDNEHNKAWWLTMEPACPDQNIPGLARVVPNVAGNSAAVHVKNVKKARLDIARMGLNNTTYGKVITITLDWNTAPEAETTAVANEWNKKTTLELVGNWWPSKSYTVKLNGVTKSYTRTGTVMTIADIPISGTAATLKITIPSGLTNKVANSNFDTNTTGWAGNVYYSGPSGGNFTVDSVEQAHSGTKSVRIEDAKANTSPFLACWEYNPSTTISVTAGTSYTASAFVKTRALQGVTKRYANGKYDSTFNASAGVGIVWLNSSKQFLSISQSTGISGNKDWTPVEVKATAPTGAGYCKVITFVKSPDAAGSSGSAWFDDVALR